jgi:hypothetical protein
MSFKLKFCIVIKDTKDIQFVIDNHTTIYYFVFILYK